MFSRLDAKRMEFKKNVHDENLIVLNKQLKIPFSVHRCFNQSYKDRLQRKMSMVLDKQLKITFSVHRRSNQSYKDRLQVLKCTFIIEFVEKNTTTMYFLDKARKKFNNSP